MKYLVLYNEKYIKDRVPTEWALQYADFDFKKVNFDNARMYERKDGKVVIDVDWLINKVNTTEYDGVIACVDGDKLKGVWGTHNALIIAGKKFSALQVESHKGKYRTWKKDGLLWKLGGTNKKTEYPQLEYTFDHEIMHSLAFIQDFTDLLHLFVKIKQYNFYKNTFIGAKKKVRYPDEILPEVKRQFAIFKVIMDYVGDPIKLVEGARGCELQEKYYKEGKSNAKCGESMHQYGIAIDYCFTTGKAYPPSGDKRWKRANAIATALGFYSYGLELGWDDGHIQLMLDYKSEKDVINNIDYSKYE